MTRAATRPGRALEGPPVRALRVDVYTYPTEQPESDGTFEWDATTLVVARVEAGGVEGLGYTYAGPEAGRFIAAHLRRELLGRDALDLPAAWRAMRRAARNAGRPGAGSAAISAVDAALWDAKARLLGLPLALLLGRARGAVPVYGSGGFTNYTEERLAEQLAGWAEQGLRWVKMKVGREPGRDARRVAAARRAIGPGVGLMVDANGAYARKEALALAERFAGCGVGWFEEPVSSQDLEGLRLLRDRAPAGMEVAAGEYGYDLADFRLLLESGAVDALQADATRCQGVSGFLQVSALCEAFGVPLSAHTAPALHLPLGCACAPLRHLEWFHDHARLERVFFDGAAAPRGGLLAPDLSRPGLGLELREADARRHRVASY